MTSKSFAQVRDVLLRRKAEGSKPGKRAQGDEAKVPREREKIQHGLSPANAGDDGCNFRQAAGTPEARKTSKPYDMFRFPRTPNFPNTPKL